jgi:hypothetical protein
MPIFDRASLATAVNQQLRSVDLGKDEHAVVAVVTRDADVAAKVGEHWELRAAVAIDHARYIAGGFEVKASW